MRLDGNTAEVQGLSEDQIEETLTQHRQVLEPCLVEARRRDPRRMQARLEFVVNGKGQVLATRVDGSRSSSLARCVHKEMRTIRFPSFKMSRMVASMTLAMPQ
jgi:hypothetical protein